MVYTVITGASSGIGRELAFIYAQKGHHLILIARRMEILEEMKVSLELKYQVLVQCVECDLNDAKMTNKVFDQINKNYEINCLINNAGIGVFEEVKDLTLLAIEEQVNINIIAPMICSKNLITNIMRNKGSVVNVCSVLSYLPNLKSSVYTASKHALYGFSNTLRLEYPLIHVLTVHPKTVNTAFFKDDNYLKNVKHPLSPVIIAKKTYQSYIKRKRICNIPKSIGILNILYIAFPHLIDSLNRKFFSNK